MHISSDYMYISVTPCTNSTCTFHFAAHTGMLWGTTVHTLLLHLINVGNFLSIYVFFSLRHISQSTLHLKDHNFHHQYLRFCWSNSLPPWSKIITTHPGLYSRHRSISASASCCSKLLSIHNNIFFGQGHSGQLPTIISPLLLARFTPPFEQNYHKYAKDYSPAIGHFL